MFKSRRYLSLAIIISVLVFAGMLFFKFKNKIASVALPPERPYNPIVEAPKENSTLPSAASDDPASPLADSILPAEINLKIPFTSQAPHQNWDLPYQQFCEEAAVLMVASFVNKQPILNSNDADKKLLAIRDFEMKKFGFYEDTTTEETAVILREYYNIANVEIVFSPTIENIKKALAEGKVVVAPMAGRQLGNPNYKQPGPLYHMLVIKGYKKNGDFITNDSGTRKGADYIYQADVIMQAMHDWNGGKVKTGKKVMLIVG